MAARTFSDPLTALDLYFVAPIFDPGSGAGGLGTAGLRPVSVDRADTFIAQAEESTNREVYGGNAGLAVALMAAHMLYEDFVANGEDPIAEAQLTAVAGGYAGPITSETMGPVSRSFSAAGSRSNFKAGGDAAFANEPLATTPWGKRLILLRKKIGTFEVAV